MPVAIRSSTKNYVASAQTITATTPAGAVAGDMLVVFCMADGTSPAPNWSAAVPADWELLQEQGPTGSGFFAVFRRILPAGTPPASFTFNIAGATNYPLHAIAVCLNPDGGAFGVISSSKSGATSATSTTGAVTGVAGDSVLLCGFSNNNNRTITTPPSGMTQLQFSDQSTSDVYVYGQLTPGAGSITKSATWDLSSGVMALAVLVPMATGPTFTTQPTAQTAIISNGGTAAFSAAATGTGTVTLTAEIETGVGTGVYGTLANGSGATWTGLTASGSGSAALTLAGTFTDITLSGRRIRIRGVDPNGTQYSAAVVLTIRTGPVLSVTDGTLDGAGQLASTLTCDVVCGTGQFVRLRGTKDGVTIYGSAVTT